MKRTQQQHLQATQSPLMCALAIIIHIPSHSIAEGQCQCTRFSLPNLVCSSQVSCATHRRTDGYVVTEKVLLQLKSDSVQYKKQIGTHREKKRVLTLTLMLVRRKSACKTSAGSCKILRWLTPLLGPNLDPKTGPKQSPKRRNVNVIQFRTPILGSIFGPKSGVSHRRILQLPADVLQADLRRTSMSVSVNTRFFSLCVPICFLYSRGPFLAAMFLLVFWILFWGP